jgi:hypothetical protein
MFLGKRGYRLRRVNDAARALPLIGAFLFCFPVLWSRPAAPDAPRPGLAEQGLYVFAVWLTLVGLAAIIAWRLRGQEAALPSAPQSRPAAASREAEGAGDR